MQIFSKYGRKCKHITFITSNFVIRPQIWIFLVFKHCQLASRHLNGWLAANFE